MHCVSSSPLFLPTSFLLLPPNHFRLVFSRLPFAVSVFISPPSPSTSVRVFPPLLLLVSQPPFSLLPPCVLYPPVFAHAVFLFYTHLLLFLLYFPSLCLFFLMCEVTVLLLLSFLCFKFFSLFPCLFVPFPEAWCRVVFCVRVRPWTCPGVSVVRDDCHRFGRGDFNFLSLSVCLSPGLPTQVSVCVSPFRKSRCNFLLS